MDPVEYETIENYMKFQNYPAGLNKNAKRFLRRKASSYAIKSYQLVEPKGDYFPLVIKADKVPDILREIHDNTGHQWFRYSYSIAKERYYWERGI